jgi:DNA (cytosine-5)-methyltransferase 1
MKTLTATSLFCGCGGTDVGMLGGFDFLGNHYSAHRIKIVFANDFEPSACDMFQANFGIDPDRRDVRKIPSQEIPNSNIILGGFPCQSFSIIAQNPPRLGVKSDKGKLFFEMCRIIKEKQPEFFIAENVKGILSANSGKAFPLILNEFAKCGYKVKWQLLKAVDFGIPQKRERVIIVGTRNDLNFEFDFSKLPTRKESEYVPLSKVILDEVDPKYYFSSKAVAGMERVKGRMNKGRAQDVSKPCNTVGAHLAKVSLNSTDPVLQIGDRFRRFTPREVARIQSFPDSYKLVGSEHNQYLALGNAIAPVMFWHIIDALLRQIKEKGIKVTNK